MATPRKSRATAVETSPKKAHAATGAGVKPKASAKPAPQPQSETLSKVPRKTATKPVSKTASKNALVSPTPQPPSAPATKTTRKNALPAPAVAVAVPAAAKLKSAVKAPAKPSAKVVAKAAAVAPAKEAAKEPAKAPAKTRVKTTPKARAQVPPPVTPPNAAKAAKAATKPAIQAARKVAAKPVTQTLPADPVPVKPVRKKAPKPPDALETVAEPAVAVKRARKTAAEASVAPAPAPVSPKPVTPAKAKNAQAVKKVARRSSPVTPLAVPSASAKAAKPKASKSASPSPVQMAIATPVLPPAPVLPAPTPSPWQLHSKPASALFGTYQVLERASGQVLTLKVRGSQRGHAQCDCRSFADSDHAQCEHLDFLLSELETSGPAVAARLEQGEQTEYSEIWLVPGLERRWLARVGSSAPAALQQAFDEAQDLNSLQALAAAHSHEMRVDPAVWTQMAITADTLQRVARLEAAYPQGPSSADLQALMQAPVPSFQCEAALFALCAGRALLADDLGLSQRAPALLSLRLWQALFGVESVLLVAPVARHAAWRASAANLLGEWPSGLSICSLEHLDAAARPELLIVDAVQDLHDVSALQALQAPHLLLLADRELLGSAHLPVLVAWLDEARRGPLAALLELGPDARPPQHHAALQTLMLSRSKRDLAERLPASFDTCLSLDAGLCLPTAALAQARGLQARWQRLAFLSASEQLQLVQALVELRATAQSEPALKRKADALLDLLPDILPERAHKLLICAQQDATLTPLAQALSAQGLAVANVRLKQSTEVRALEVAAWQNDEVQILLATDGACAGLDLVQNDVALIHADLPWNPAQVQARLARATRTPRGLPVWLLCMQGTLDAALLAAQHAAAACPAATLDFEPGALPFVQGADLPALMAQVVKVLGQ